VRFKVARIISYSTIASRSWLYHRSCNTSDKFAAVTSEGQDQVHIVGPPSSAVSLKRLELLAIPNPVQQRFLQADQFKLIAPIQGHSY
jgi:hypothetical protein